MIIRSLLTLHLLFNTLFLNLIFLFLRILLRVELKKKKKM